MIKSNKPGILMIGILPPPEGGMATSLKNLVHSGLRNKYNITVLDVTGYRTRKKGTILRGAFHQLYLVFRLIYLLLKENPSIVHVQMAHYLYFYRRAVDILISKLFMKKVVVHIRGSRFTVFYDKNNVIGKTAIKLIFKLCDKIITLSEFWHNFLAKIVDPNKLVTIPNGVRCDDFKITRNKKRELGLRDDSIMALSMGVMGKSKGIYDTLKSIRHVRERVDNITFIFCGPPAFGTNMNEFYSTVKQERAEPYVKYVGVVAGREKIDYYLSSDIFILPSYADNFPNSILEAMAAGLSIIASDIGAIPEVIKNGVNGFVIKPGDVNALSQGIIELAKNSMLRKRFGENNITLARNLYDMPIIEGMIDELYRKMLRDR